MIPTHERPELLRESMASILRQTCTRPFELVVIDDAPSPSTESVVAEARRTSRVPIHYVCREGRKGASASRNFALSVAEGDLFAFLDDDDIWDESFLARTAAALEAGGADMAVTWLSVLDLDGSIRPLYRIQPGMRPREAAARNGGFTGSNFLIRRSAFEALNGFDADLQVSNDKDFFIRFLLSGFEYTVVRDYLAIHRRHSGPQLTTGDERRASGVEAYLRKHNGVLTLSGKRYLRKRVHRIRMRTSPSAIQRLLHTFAFAANLSLSDVRSKLRRLDGRYTDLR
ncbi:glycosyltransferase family 2 protein [Mycolicibacterium baixiangningiae]|uniref:glycosyltransferase family 2 protein n=1 Tax=Mycolicibacterium baixiangningiae TaxID=2761578 RepID=UPI003557C7BF